jgi:hypothetical protein
MAGSFRWTINESENVQKRGFSATRGRLGVRRLAAALNARNQIRVQRGQQAAALQQQCGLEIALIRYWMYFRFQASIMERGYL